MKQQYLFIVLLITMVKSISCGGVLKVSPLIVITWMHLTLVTRLTTLLLKWSYCLMTIWNQQFIMKKKAEFMMLYGALFPVLFVFVYICVFDKSDILFSL